MTPLRLGIVGLGRGFLLTLPSLRTTADLRLVAAHDVRTAALDHFRREFDGQTYDDLGALLSSDEIDAVYVATPHEFHASQAIAALDAGKHVLVEKPMATSVPECIQMEAAARASGKVLMVGPSHGFDRPVQDAARIVASGEFGPVRMVTTFNFTDFMYRPRRPEELDVTRGGGVVYSQGAHQIDVVRRIVGSAVCSIRAITGNWDVERPSDGAYAAFLTFENGACATITYSGYAHYDSDELTGWVSELGFPKDAEAYGDARARLASLSPTEEIAAKQLRTFGAFPGQGAHTLPPHHEHFGFVLVSCERADIKLSPFGIRIYGDAERRTIDIPPPASPRAEVIGEFIDAIAGLRPPVHDGRWGLETMACCTALIESSQSNREADPRTIIERYMKDINE